MIYNVLREGCKGRLAADLPALPTIPTENFMQSRRSLNVRFVLLIAGKGNSTFPGSETRTDRKSRRSETHIAFYEADRQELFCWLFVRVTGLRKRRLFAMRQCRAQQNKKLPDQ
jgi:hypothetical protein